MTTIAAIFDAEGDPLFGEYIIDSDDDFDAVEATAKDVARNGTRCCIWWQRSDDGQVAYWGPKGASFKPHWYV